MNEPKNDGSSVAFVEHRDEGTASSLTWVLALAENLKLLTLAPLAVGLAALGVAFLITPTFTATTTFLPPQQQQSGSAAAAALSSLGALAGLGGVGGTRTPADQYVALMQSTAVSDRIIDRFKLTDVYAQKLRADTRRVLGQSVRFTIGKKDGLISVEVEDKMPDRAADMANGYVEELRRMTDTIAVTEAQQRRVFFEQQLERTQGRLIQAQQALQASGLTQGTLKSEPRAAAESYAKVRAEVTAAEVRLQTLRRALADTAPEVQQQLTMLGALRTELGRLEQSTNVQGGPDYVSKYREFKYQETLFDLFARQYELARVDESREGGLIQVIDKAQAPEKKSHPKRANIAVVATLVTAVLLFAFLLMRQSWRRLARDPANAEEVGRLRAAFTRRRVG